MGRLKRIGVVSWLVALGACGVEGLQSDEFGGLPDDAQGQELVPQTQALLAGLHSDVTANRAGTSETVAVNPIDLSSHNGFFKEFGTNGRSCGTCHVEGLGWSITPEHARKLRKDDPLFRFDGSDCLPAGVRNPNPHVHSKEMLRHANVRVEIPVPPNADFVLEAATNPHACPTPPNPAGLHMFRRPLPTTNIEFLATIMWDGRENSRPTIFGSLLAQANGATRGHAQAAADLTDTDQNELVSFELGIFNAQLQVGNLRLDRYGAKGGAAYLLTDVLPQFFIGINDPFMPGFTNRVFTLFEGWEPGARCKAPNAMAASIGRGEKLFNETSILITNVAGINGPNDASQAPVAGFCGTCHDSPNVGNHSVTLPIDIGIADPRPAARLDVRDLPLYTFKEISTGERKTLTDPGRGLISGRFADLGKFKGPILRGLAGRAPYFHNGGAKDLRQVVDFYDERFEIGFSERQKRDLTAFLQAL